ncbi:MAG: HAMP domain-containing histidine kinase [Chloroflexota bacterium]|nr:HAMP domain-containing histidine kinase [Chloroflexota bacterium]
MRWYGAWTDIHQERMALAEAEAALKTRDQFLSIASHELRTPLTSLLGYAHMLPIALSQGKGDPAKMAGMIARQAERLNALVDHLLDVSRLQRGQLAVERQAVDLRVLAAQVVDEFRVAHKLDTRHPIELLRADEPVTVAGDGPRLEQVLRNLLSNAVKYSPHGGPVQVHVTRTPMEAVLEVADRSIGIPAEAQAHLFDAFYRARNVGSQISGFGLGLHIVHEIVQRHGGRIEVDSTEGVGSTFRVVLPRHQSDGPNSDSA